MVRVVTGSRAVTGSGAYDAVVVGSGPNGLAAAIALASWGHSVCLIERAARLGGGLLTHGELESGFVHDHCSAIHPMGLLSPFFRGLHLEEHGLRWRSSEISVAHPQLEGDAVLLGRDLAQLGERLPSKDAAAWRRLVSPLAHAGLPFLTELLGPPPLFPARPWPLLRFAWHGLRSATSLARSQFESSAARNLFLGLAAHSTLPLTTRPSAAVGLVFAMSAHLVDWPCVEGGSERLAEALVAKFRALGGEVVTGCDITGHEALPPHRVALYDVAPRALAEIAGDQLSSGYVRRLARFRYGPGVFKVDYTLDGPIPWRDPSVARASTVHVGASVEEMCESERAPFEGRLSSYPYLIVCQQSSLDPSRAPQGKHTGYAYCHVPHGYTGDALPLIEAQLERFAPGFVELVRQRRVTRPSEFEAQNPNLLGGTISGGVTDLGQLFTRPIARWDPYSTPNRRIFLCSASTPPGGGVHGMCGYHAARSASRALGRVRPRGALLDVSGVPALPEVAER